VEVDGAFRRVGCEIGSGVTEAYCHWSSWNRDAVYAG
jgi:hypothetical protein